MTAEDEIRQAQAIANRYDALLAETRAMSASDRSQYIFERMREFRQQYRESFLQNRNY